MKAKQEKSGATKLLESVRVWAYEDEESPRRAAVLFLSEDVVYSREVFTNAILDAIEERIHGLTDDECVTICRAHGALLS